MNPKRRRARRRAIDGHPDPIPTNPPIEADNRAAIASNYLHHLDVLVKNGVVKAAILRCRVSRQDQRAQLDDQAAAMRRRVEDELGIPVVGVFEEVAPGWDLDQQHELDAAIQAAITHGPGTVIVAETTCRYLRHPNYNTDKKSPPTVAAFHALIDRAHGMSLGTILHPDATLEEVRRYQQNRGKVAKGNSGGRPRKPIKTTKEEFAELKPGKQRPMWQSKAFWFKSLGFSVRKTAKMLGKRPTQIQRWFDKLKAGTPVTTHLPPPRPKRSYTKKSANEDG